MNSENISVIIRHASILSVAFPLLFYFIRIKHANKSAHIIGAITIVSALSDGISYYLFSQGRSTMMLFNIHDVSSFLLLTWLYYEILSTFSNARLVVVALIIYLLSFVLVTTYVQSFFEYQTLMWTLAGVISILYSISYFVSVFSSLKPMSNAGLLWVNSGILFYFSFNLFLFIMSSYVLTKLDPELGMIIWSFHNVNNILKNILTGFGLYTFRENLQTAELGAR